MQSQWNYHLPSTVTWQEHSAWPAAFLATHLYVPLSSGNAFSMDTEHREPERKKKTFIGIILGPAHSQLEREEGAGKCSLSGEPWRPDVRGVWAATPQPTKARVPGPLSCSYLVPLLRRHTDKKGENGSVVHSLGTVASGLFPGWQGDRVRVRLAKWAAEGILSNFSK